MKAVLSMGWPLILMRVGPADVPHAPRVLPLLLLLNLGLSAVIQQFADSGLDRPVLTLSAIALAAEALWVRVLLARRDAVNRWTQTFTALVLVDTFIAVMAAPVSLLLMQGGDSLAPVIVLFQMLAAIWSLAVRGRIYGSALEVSGARSILLALAPLFLAMLLALPLLPELVPATPAAG